MDRELFDLAARAGQALKARGWMLVTAESCTGGWVSECVTMVPGSSEWFERGFVTYTNVAKREMLGVRSQTLDTHGAVSEQTVREMVVGALAGSHGQIAVAVSGVAGPAGGTAQKPVGMVCFALGDAGNRTDRRHPPARRRPRGGAAAVGDRRAGGRAGDGAERRAVRAGPAVDGRPQSLARCRGGSRSEPARRARCALRRPGNRLRGARHRVTPSAS